MRKLYLYMKADYLISTLEKDEIKVVLPDECNDPFEFMPASKDGKVPHDTKGTGIICFSEDCLSTTMWAHYADKHKGVCLEFTFPYTNDFFDKEVRVENDASFRTDFAVLMLNDSERVKQFSKLPLPDEKRYEALMMKVKYYPYRAYPAETQMRCVVSGGEIQDARYSRLYAAKGQEWAYEKEWRLFVTLDNCLSYHDGCYFVKGLTKYITKVLLGCKCELPPAYVQEVLKKKSRMRKKAKVEKMEVDGNLFAVKQADESNSKEPRAWHLYLEFSNEQWLALKSFFKNIDPTDFDKRGGCHRAVFEFLKKQCHLPESNHSDDNKR